MMPQTTVEKYAHTSKSIVTRLPEQEYKTIISFVEEGLFLNTTDFIIEAINEKINRMEEIVLRDIPLSQQRTEIIEYAKEHENEILDADIIANALRLDVFEVDDIMTELIKENILEEIK